MLDINDNFIRDRLIITEHPAYDPLMEIIAAVDTTICERILVRPQDFHVFNGVPPDASIDLISVLEYELEMSTNNRDWACKSAGEVISELENACTTMYACNTGISNFDYGRQEDVDKLHAFLYTYILVSLGDHNHGKLLEKLDYDY